MTCENQEKVSVDGIMIICLQALEFKLIRKRIEFTDNPKYLGQSIS